MKHELIFVHVMGMSMKTPKLGFWLESCYILSNQ